MKAETKNRFIIFIREGWRPIMAITLIIILFLYFIIGFFLKIYGIETPELPNEVWALATVFAGSYTLSRGAEKFSKEWNKNKN